MYVDLRRFFACPQSYRRSTFFRIRTPCPTASRARAPRCQVHHELTSVSDRVTAGASICFHDIRVVLA
jgi:hypothetical protein